MFLAMVLPSDISPITSLAPVTNNQVKGVKMDKLSDESKRLLDYVAAYLIENIPSSDDPFPLIFGLGSPEQEYLNAKYAESLANYIKKDK